MEDNILLLIYSQVILVPILGALFLGARRERQKIQKIYLHSLIRLAKRR